MADPKIPGGYILFARKSLESEFMDKPPLYSKLWQWILLSANHKDGYRGLKRGEFFTSIEDMRDAMSYYIGYRKKSPTVKEIRRAYEWLKEGTMIVITKGTRGMYVSIPNYDFYQNPENYEGHNEGHNENPPKGTEGAHYKQEGYNNDKNDNPSLEGDEKPKDPICPYQEIVNLHIQHCPDLPCPDPEDIPERLKSTIRARWKESLKKKDRQGLEWFEWYFSGISKCDKLMGRTSLEWTASFEWLMGPKNMTKVLSGNYNNRQKAKGSEREAFLDGLQKRR